MKRTVYLPDELDAEVKESDINLSGLLQNAVREEMLRLKCTSDTLSESAEIELTLLDDEERSYIGRFTGTLLAEGRTIDAYINNEEQVLLHDRNNGKIHYIESEELESWLDEGAYIEAMHALGEKPIVSI